MYNIHIAFEWYERKRRINVKKHGIDFIDVPEMFDDDVIIIPDERFEYGEHRYIGIGLIKGRVVVAAYTERVDNIRIISVRKATKNEQIFYLKKISD